MRQPRLEPNPAVSQAKANHLREMIERIEKDFPVTAGFGEADLPIMHSSRQTEPAVILEHAAAFAVENAGAVTVADFETDGISFQMGDQAE